MAESLPRLSTTLDIEYTEEHNYLVWHKNTFADPSEMITTGRKTVEHKVFAKLPDGSEYKE
ncbi:uncharacterized protein MELLADRAFT_95077 [Melampsora larici-populina 98AG31]|uniref:Uncharacterized protein n=1 Tax=Melampsora larici-populina (strain 98AG31 / pathotype 3-4-7) TaxID=747676 RepID=F4S921_MELLP|nr:uncharacterized protein MELLADRAFT_95077 [Melampsora larici-populina 98AG31]EGF98838.1 hypothetical protein MELLADRAFT_95077 [Melampsora larici-populina 98AG31]